MALVNIILGFNTVFALLVLFGTTIGVIGWVCLVLLKRIARLLRPLAGDDKAVPRHVTPADANRRPQDRKLAA